MPVTPTPIFGQIPKIDVSKAWVNGTTANTKNNGEGTIGTDILLIFTAGSNGAYIDKIRLSVCGTTAATASTATVGRIYLSTATSGATTSTNTHLWQEVACPSQTTDQTTTATVPIDIPMGIRIEAGTTILFSMHHVAAANTFWEPTVIATNY
jgi:FlaG/FlaF family flagellin (archaellin)